jgi:DNA transformation protein
MPVTPEKVAALLEPLQAARPITSRKMFGGIGIYFDGVFFAVIDDDHLYFKADEINSPTYDAYESSQWIIEGDPPSPMPYREVPKEILHSSDEVGAWIDAAVAVALRKKKPTKPKKPHG